MVCEVRTLSVSHCLLGIGRGVEHVVRNPDITLITSQ